MAFRKHHGITLAANSWIENLHVERLASDPAPVSAGRIWFNTTDKALRFSSLDGVGAVIVIDISSAADLAALESIVTTINGDSTTEGSFRKEIADIVGAAPEALDTLQEIATALNNDPDLYNTLVNLVNTSISDLNEQIIGTATEAMDTLGEVQAVIGDKATLTTTDKTNLVAAINEVLAGLTQEISDRTAHANEAIRLAVEAANDLSQEVQDRADADNAINLALSTETTNRINGDAAILSELAATKAGAGLSVDGEHQDRTGTNYLDTATTLAEEAGLLDTALKAESDRAVAAEGVNAQAIADETTRATGVEGALENLQTTDKTNLVAAINEVAEAAGDGTDALKTAINAKKSIFTAQAAALNHTFNHGFAGADLDVTVWVYDESNSKWYNDSVLVEVDPATTTVTVPLQAAAIVKIIVEDLSDVA